MRGEFAESRLMSDKRDAMPLGHSTQLVHDLPRRVARGERVEHLDGCLVAETVREERRRLLCTDERAGENLVDADVQPCKPRDRFVETIDACLRQRSLRIVRPVVATVRSYRVTHQIQVAGFHASGGGTAGVVTLADFRQPVAHRNEFRASGHVVAVQLTAFGFEATNQLIEIGRHLER